MLKYVPNFGSFVVKRRMDNRTSGSLGSPEIASFGNNILTELLEILPEVIFDRPSGLHTAVSEFNALSNSLGDSLRCHHWFLRSTI